MRDVFQVLRDTQRLSRSCLKLFGLFLFVTRNRPPKLTHPFRKKLSIHLGLGVDFKNVVEEEDGRVTQDTLAANEQYEFKSRGLLLLMKRLN